MAGDETPSSFRKTPRLELALLDLQRRYVATQGHKPSPCRPYSRMASSELYLNGRDLPAYGKTGTNCAIHGDRDAEEDRGMT